MRDRYLLAPVLCNLISLIQPIYSSQCPRGQGSVQYVECKARHFLSVFICHERPIVNMAVDARKKITLKIVERLGIGFLLGGMSSTSCFSSRFASDLSFEAEDSSPKEV